MICSFALHQTVKPNLYSCFFFVAVRETDVCPCLLLGQSMSHWFGVWDAHVMDEALLKQKLKKNKTNNNNKKKIPSTEWVKAGDIQFWNFLNCSHGHFIVNAFIALVFFDDSFTVLISLSITIVADSLPITSSKTKRVCIHFSNKFHIKGGHWSTEHMETAKKMHICVCTFEGVLHKYDVIICYVPSICSAAGKAFTWQA